MNALYSSVKETHSFLKNFNEFLIKSNTNHPHNGAMVEDIKIYRGISSKILSNIRGFDRNFEWSDDEFVDSDENSGEL
jgi:hypothetical protein